MRAIQPTISAWLFAFISGAVTLGLAAFAMVYGLLWEQSVAAAHVQNAIKSSDAERVRRFFPLMELGTDRIETVLSLIFPDNNYETRRQTRLVSFSLGFKRDLSQTLEVTEALGEFEDITTEELNFDARVHVGLVKETLKEIIEIQRDLQENRRNADVATRHETQIIEQHALVGDDLSELMSLPSRYSRGDQSSLFAYQDGILKDLPQLENLADNISDIIALRSALEAAGGKVKIDADDIALAFSEKLDSLRALSEELASDFKSTHEGRIKGEQSIVELTAKRLEAETCVRREVGALFALLTETPLFI